jgi:hypothetical protein
VSSQPAAAPETRPQELPKTSIGVGIGVTRLAVAATAEGGPDDAVVVDGTEIRTLYAEFTHGTQALTRDTEPTPESLGALVAEYWPQFEPAFDRAAGVLLEYARQYPQPVLAFEQLGHERKPLVACKHGNVAPSEWIPSVAVHELVERVRGAGVPVITADPDGTTSECHRCGERGEVGRDLFTCLDEECPVNDVCRDRSAAVSLAKRV